MEFAGSSGTGGRCKACWLHRRLSDWRSRSVAAKLWRADDEVDARQLLWPLFGYGVRRSAADEHLGEYLGDESSPKWWANRNPRRATLPAQGFCNFSVDTCEIMTFIFNKFPFESKEETW